MKGPGGIRRRARKRGQQATELNVVDRAEGKSKGKEGSRQYCGGDERMSEMLLGDVRRETI